ncbi:Transcription factor bHLH155 [Apostasia shenzhenica]|uniref:Transcription factor bHLH155 n=1 Tax=Apostasia shenzhenica TaxID=1088818 RepID=A0A2I0A6G8_9ASPA|nr:Transcription factor bHLH155 [Apostasia shenzhenica]
MGKVASDKCHKWVFKEPSDCEPNISNYWQSSFDALPPEWTDQFASGIQTIAVIQAGHGLLQLGSCKIIPEDLHFVLRMRHMFESLGYQSGYFLSQLFSSTRAAAPLLSQPVKQTQVAPPQAIFNWNHPPLPAVPPVANMAAAHGFHPSARSANSKEDTHLFLLPHSDASSSQMEDMIADHEGDLKWPNGLSFFNALTGRSDDAKLDGLGSDPPVRHQQPLMASGKSFGVDDSKAEASRPDGSGGAEDYLGLESRSAGKMRKMESSKFKRSFTLPARMTSTSSSSAATPQGMEYRGSEAGIYSDIMETFLEFLIGSNPGHEGSLSLAHDEPGSYSVIPGTRVQNGACHNQLDPTAPFPVQSAFFQTHKPRICMLQTITDPQKKYQ